MNPALEGYTAAVLETAAAEGQVATLSQDLQAINRLFATNDLLRVAMSDTVVPAIARRAVLDQLLEHKVSVGARRAAVFAAGAVRAPEVPLAIDGLAISVREVAEGEEPAEPLLGHMDARERVGGYAAAVFEGLSNDDLAVIEDELFRFTRIVESVPALRSVLVDRDAPLEVRRGVVHELLASKVTAASMRLIDYVLVGGRPRDFIGTVDWLVVQTAKARGWRVARVHSALDVEPGAGGDLTDSLSRVAGAPVELQVTLDPDLLAGVVVRIGDLQVDASARGRIEALREHLSSSSWSELGRSDHDNN